MSTNSKADIKSEQTQQKHQQQQEQNGSAIDVLNITNTLLAILIVYALYKLFGKKKSIVIFVFNNFIFELFFIKCLLKFFIFG